MKAKKFFENIIFVLICLVINQAVEYYAYNGRFGSFLNYLHPFLGKLLLPNYNFAFGIPLPHVFAYILYLVIFIFFIFWYVGSAKERYQRLAFYLILSGAISNLLDRFLFGYVRDFIYIFWGSVFNLADVMIICGILLILFRSRESKKISAG